MSEFLGIIQAHMDRTGVREAEFARRIRLTPQAVNTWRHRGIRRLPERRILDAVAEVTGVDYTRVLFAVLRDTGYLGTTTPPVTAPIRHELDAALAQQDGPRLGDGIDYAVERERDRAVGL
ncbi:hypothetical protein [Nocardia wallacei]|uniref:hypothetical protein n=1 Tax=Nocardia wallacei TaxID=480035 RepID=UPI0024575EC3|nr:hypothetical protein [Nocardia wallacei]